jgi:hypothetical protein
MHNFATPALFGDQAGQVKPANVLKYRPDFRATRSGDLRERERLVQLL